MFNTDMVLDMALNKLLGTVLDMALDMALDKLLGTVLDSSLHLLHPLMRQP